jgi:hypothetical protein
MARELPPVSQLPERDRRQRLARFLEVLDRHPDLDHFRAAIPTGPERQLALFAALERSALLGSPAVHPPRPDDPADMLLCDLLDAIDRHAELKNVGSAYGPDRHVANLLALGVWDRKAIPTRSVAGELFATWFSSVNSDPTSTSPSSPTILSPGSQESGSGGELIAPPNDVVAPAAESPPATQDVETTPLTPDLKHNAAAHAASNPRGIIRHGSETAGEQSSDGLTDPSLIPSRTVRRGRPPALDDIAKGRLLGLMSYGLSFRQAAAQLGVHHQTLLNLMKRDPEFAQQVSEARLDAISQPLLTIVQASRTSWRAAAWLARFLEERRVRNLETTPEERELDRDRRS